MSGRPLRVLLVHPGASWSVADVFDGLDYGLKQHGVEVFQYRLDKRLDQSKKAAFGLWRKNKKADPDLTKPGDHEIFYHASADAVLMALNAQVDVVLVVSAMFFHPDVIVLMKRAGLRVVTLFTESPYNHEQELKVAKLVDGCWTHERTVLPEFRAVNANTGYLPHGWHPLKHFAGEREEEVTMPQHDVVFVGSGFPERIEFFNKIDWTGIDLGLYGSWDKSLGLTPRAQSCVKGGVVGNWEASALYRRAKIGLNLYRNRNIARMRVHGESLSPRAYELAACGAFHLSEYRPEVAEVFGDLVPTFKTPQEANDLIRQWLGNTKGRAEKAAELPAKVAEASWVNRAATVMGDLARLLHVKAA